jgi:hypothetical protein
VRAENLQSSPAWNQNKVLGEDSAQERRACGQHAVRHIKPHVPAIALRFFWLATEERKTTEALPFYCHSL